MTQAITTHYETVGSFLRPAALKQARADYEAVRIDAQALKAVEDAAIIDLVNKQKMQVIRY